MTDALLPQYQFTNDWFSTAAKTTWDQLIPQIKPSKVLEIGSYEGASACYLIQKLAANAPLDMHCVDIWSNADGSTGVGPVEARFQHNTKLAVASAAHPVALSVHKGPSSLELAKLLVAGREGYFDFIYIDGSHQAPEVLCDAVLAFRLLRVGGVMVFDDYLWSENLPYGKDPVRSPKLAVDAFTNIYVRKINILTAPLYQLYVQKTAA